METSVYSLLVFAISAYQLVPATNAGPQCYQCDSVSSPDECSTIITCGDHQKCVSQMLLSSSSRVYYKLGCLDVATCQQSSYSLFGTGFPGVGKRDNKKQARLEPRQAHDFSICLGCCDGDFCNLNTCGPKSNTNLNRCFECRSVLHPRDCDSVNECGTDHFCYVHKGPVHVTNVYRYDMGCMPQRTGLPMGARMYAGGNLVIDSLNETNAGVYACVAVSSTGRVALKHLVVKIAATPAIAIAIIRKPTGSLVPGQAFSLRCKVIGYPVPSVTWTFHDLRGLLTIPSNVKYSERGHVLLVDHYSYLQHAGYWTCRAANKYGQSQARVHLP